jgi:hypothetical protein
MALRPSRSSNRTCDRQAQETKTDAVCGGAGFRPVEIPGCNRGGSAVFSLMGDCRSCLGATFFCGARRSYPYVDDSVALSGSSWHCEAGYGAGHLVVRAAGPQGANVRQAANIDTRTACGLKGRRLSTVSVPTHLRIACARSPGRLSRRALSPSLANRALFGAAVGRPVRSRPAGLLHRHQAV